MTTYFAEVLVAVFKPLFELSPHIVNQEERLSMMKAFVQCLYFFVISPYISIKIYKFDARRGFAVKRTIKKVWKAVW